MPRLAAAFGRAACILIAGCQYSPGPSDRTIAYNEAVANSTNAFFLLNALRARDRLPIHYTRTTGLTSGVSFNPAAKISIPLNGDPNDKISPEFSIGSTLQNQ